MPRRSDKRERLLETAVEVVHRQGFNRTTLADIANRAEVPLGNVYYYFKTKQEIGEAIVDRRLQHYRQLREVWQALSDPKERLRAFVRMTEKNKKELARSGCPIGTLCGELQKDGGTLATRASALFAEFIDWLAEQFRELGQGKASRDLAIQLLSSLEGATLLSHSFRSVEFIHTETRRLEKWIETL